MAEAEANETMGIVRVALAHAYTIGYREGLANGIAHGKTLGRISARIWFWAGVTLLSLSVLVLSYGVLGGRP